MNGLEWVNESQVGEQVAVLHTTNSMCRNAFVLLKCISVALTEFVYLSLSSKGFQCQFK